MKIIEIRKIENGKEQFFCYEIEQEDGVRTGNIREGSLLFEEVREVVKGLGVSEVRYWEVDKLVGFEDEKKD